jgi:glycosyltransferase involved in cell wall biosynthesis
MRVNLLDGVWITSHPVYELIMSRLPPGLERTDNYLSADVVFVPTRPEYAGPLPWFVFIEDWVTLLNAAGVVNGKTAGLDILKHPALGGLRRKFATPEFRGIVCHHRGTFDDLAVLGVTDKLHYMPVGVPEAPAVPAGQRETLTFTCINTYLAGPTNFRNRGGELVLRAFDRLLEGGRRDIRLQVLSGIPDDCQAAYVAHKPEVTWIPNHLYDADWRQRLEATDVLLLPSHRVHVHSILKPMSLGIPVVTSDGWGNDEYVVDGATGCRVPGVWGVTSWRQPGDVMREDYSRWPQTLEVGVRELSKKMAWLADNRGQVRRLGANAQRYVREVHSISRMQTALAAAVSN